MVLGSSRYGRDVPDAAVARLPLYLRVLADADGVISSEQLAEMAGVNAAKVRKDLSYLGTYGTRGVGYDVEQLRHELATALGLTADVPVVMVGLGHLGQALARYSGFGTRGFRIVGLFDSDPNKINTRVEGFTVQDVKNVCAFCREQNVTIAVLTVPSSVAQTIADQLVGCGVRSLLNFAPTVLNVPSGVVVRQVDLAGELQILSYHQQNRIPQTVAPLAALP